MVVCAISALAAVPVLITTVNRFAALSKPPTEKVVRVDMTRAVVDWDNSEQESFKRREQLEDGTRTLIRTCLLTERLSKANQCQITRASRRHGRQLHFTATVLYINMEAIAVHRGIRHTGSHCLRARQNIGGLFQSSQSSQYITVL